MQSLHYVDVFSSDLLLFILFLKVPYKITIIIILPLKSWAAIDYGQKLVEGHVKRPWHNFDADWPKGGAIANFEQAYFMPRLTLSHDTLRTYSITHKEQICLKHP